jgi:sulfopyruvate decarboxylase subunit beta
MITIGSGILRTEAIDILAELRGDALTIITMQPVAAWRAVGQNNSRNLELLGSMGSASAIALGLAIGFPDEQIFVLDGDGSLVMQLGTLISIGTVQPPNLYHFVFENGVYETSGKQPVPGVATASLSDIALASGYRAAFCVDSLDNARAVISEAINTEGPVFISLKISGQGTITTDSKELPRSSFPQQVQTLRSKFLEQK